MSAHKDIVQSIKSVQEVSKPVGISKISKFPKTDLRYWQSAIFQPTFTKAGETHQAADWSAKIQHQGQRETFALGTPNKAAAASRAKDIYLSLRGAGWEATLTNFKPRTIKLVVPDAVATVGEFIAAAKVNFTGRGKTFEGYAKALRKIVADISGIDGGKAKFDHAKGGNQKWLDQINTVSLSTLTSENVQQWKLNFVRAAGLSSSKQKAARNSANAFLRNARSLFSKKLLRFVSVKLPVPLPFAEVQFEPRGSTRYRSKVDAIALVRLAQNELAEKYPEQFKIFLLAIMAGLRRGEIDLLEWSALDLKVGVIRVQATEHYELKSEDSEGNVDIDIELSQIFEVFKRKSKGPFVIESENLPKPGVSYRYYRCERHFEALTGWLRSKDVTTNKPLHTMRKEFGSLLCERGGIYEACRALRHSDIRTTLGYYVDGKRRVTVGLGHALLSDNT